MVEVETDLEASMLCVDSLFCERDDRILFEDLNFELKEGQVLQIKGSNGSWKTTLLRNICGLNVGYEGAISWYGDPIKECQEEFYSSLVYIGQRVGGNKVLTPLENLRWSSSLQQVITDDELLDALEKVGLRGYEGSQCFTLSAGQQQRVSLSKLLLSKAKLWVLDEPFTTLDAAGVKQLETLLKTHAGNGGAVMVTTHHTLSVPNLQVLELG